MKNYEILGKLQERYGLGITITEQNQGGFIVDSTGEIRETTFGLIQNEFTNYTYTIDPNPAHLQDFKSSYYEYNSLLLLVA